MKRPRNHATNEAEPAAALIMVFPALVTTMISFTTRKRVVLPTFSSDISPSLSRHLLAHSPFRLLGEEDFEPELISTVIAEYRTAHVDRMIYD